MCQIVIQRYKTLKPHFTYVGTLFQIIEYGRYDYIIMFFVFINLHAMESE